MGHYTTSDIWTTGVDLSKIFVGQTKAFLEKGVAIGLTDEITGVSRYRDFSYRDS